MAPKILPCIGGYLCQVALGGGGFCRFIEMRTGLIINVGADLVSKELDEFCALISNSYQARNMSSDDQRSTAFGIAIAVIASLIVVGRVPGCARVLPAGSRFITAFPRH